MDEDLKQYLDGKFGRIDGRLDGIDGKFAAIDGRLIAFDDRLAQIDQRFAGMEKRFDQIDIRFDEERAVLRQVETTLLSEFHKWAQTYEVRARGTGVKVR